MSGELIVIVVIGGLGTVFGPLMGALVFLGLEEILKGFTDHWMVIFGPLIVIVALLGKRGIIGLLQRFDSRGKLPAKVTTTTITTTAAAVAATGVAKGAL